MLNFSVRIREICRLVSQMQWIEVATLFALPQAKGLRVSSPKRPATMTAVTKTLSSSIINLNQATRILPSTGITFHGQALDITSYQRLLPVLP